MSYLISYQGLTKTYHDRPLFSDLSLGFSEGDKIGLIGANGSGKSTLMKIFADQSEPDEGVRHMKKHTQITYLPQSDRLDPDHTVEEALIYALAERGMEAHQKYTLAGKTMGIGELTDPTRKVATLSGGWRKRLAICCALITEPDILFLDEPTNHLDIEGILWLEALLTSPSFSFVLVSHDRYLLENVTTTIIELGRIYPDGYLRVKGNYTHFLRQRGQFLKTQQDRESVLSNLMRQEENWLQHGPKARTTKAKFRIDKAAKMGEQLKDIRYRNQQNKTVDFNFDATRRKTKNLLMAKNIGMAMGGQTLFSGLSLKLTPGAKVGLLGKNGTGKSTLIRILEQVIPPDEGHVDIAEGLKIVAFDQDRCKLDQEAPLRTALSPEGDAVVYQGRSVHVATWAKRFLFRPDQLDLPVRRLSGGEQARILIAELMRRPADVLLLDEPTNDLDIPSIEVLEESLAEFPGAVVVVSHDRFFLDRLTDGIIGFDGRGNATIYADYLQWLDALAPTKTDTKPQKEASEKKAPPPAKPAGKKFSYKHQYELDHIEAHIMEAENQVAELEKKVQDPAVMADPAALNACCDELKTAQEKVEQLYARWQEIESLKE